MFIIRAQLPPGGGLEVFHLQSDLTILARRQNPGDRGHLGDVSQKKKKEWSLFEKMGVK